jgi:hypothetical protein
MLHQAIKSEIEMREGVIVTSSARGKRVQREGACLPQPTCGRQGRLYPWGSGFF